MTEPAELNGAGADPSMMIATCRQDGNHWVVNGKKCFITGAEGAKVGIVMAKSEDPDSAGGACMFLVDLPDPAIRIPGALPSPYCLLPTGMQRSTFVSFDDDGLALVQLTLSEASLNLLAPEWARPLPFDDAHRSQLAWHSKRFGFI